METTMMNQTTFTFRLPTDLHEAARLKSIRTKTSLNTVIVEKLIEWINEPEPTPSDRDKRPAKVKATS